MLGFVFGGNSLVLIVATLRLTIYWHNQHHARRHRPGGWRRHALYSLFERLDATPGQEKVISSALDELRESLAGLRAKFHDSRREAATAFRKEHLGDEDVNGLFSRLDEHLEGIRQAAGRAMQKIHEALDERQRGVLADLVERGGPFSMFNGGYA
jgi:hypothetical protein